MTSLEHYFENLLFQGEDVAGESNKKYLTPDERNAVETCAAYITYSIFGGEEELRDFLKSSINGHMLKWANKYYVNTCKNCRFATKEGRLWRCLNTEVNITSCNSDSFSCCKWEEKDGWVFDE